MSLTNRSTVCLLGHKHDLDSCVVTSAVHQLSRFISEQIMRCDGIYKHKICVSRPGKDEIVMRYDLCQPTTKRCDQKFEAKLHMARRPFHFNPVEDLEK